MSEKPTDTGKPPVMPSGPTQAAPPVMPMVQAPMVDPYAVSQDDRTMGMLVHLLLY